MRGRFITFEGGEGSGKSTQAKLLSDRLRAFGIGVVLTREPGGSTGAETVRHVLLSGAAKPFGAHAEAILFAAARDDHLRQTIVPALEAGKGVISDRFAESTRIYQGSLGNVDPRIIARLERITLADTRPDLTFIVDVPVDVGLQRAAWRRGQNPEDRFEAEARSFHEKLREAYRELAEREPDRCVLIDGSPDPATVGKAVWEIVNARFHAAEAPLHLEDAAQ